MSARTDAAVARFLASRAEQGLPPTVTNDEVLAAVAAVVRAVKAP